MLLKKNIIKFIYIPSIWCLDNRKDFRLILFIVIENSLKQIIHHLFSTKLEFAIVCKNYQNIYCQNREMNTSFRTCVWMSFLSTFSTDCVIGCSHFSVFITDNLIGCLVTYNINSVWGSRFSYESQRNSRLLSLNCNAAIVEWRLMI